MDETIVLGAGYINLILGFAVLSPAALSISISVSPFPFNVPKVSVQILNPPLLNFALGFLLGPGREF